MSLPARMTYITMDAPGGPEVLKPATGPLPNPKDDEVLIRVQAAGVNRPDVAQRTGNYPPPPGASPVIGLEVSGEVAALGKDVTGWAVGADGDSPDGARSLYDKLERSVLPLYYGRSERPEGWIGVMKGAIAKNASYFNSHRMMRRYATEVYVR